MSDGPITFPTPPGEGGAVMERPSREQVARRTIDRLKRFSEKLESGEPIEATEVKVEHTPDGTLTTRRKVILDNNQPAAGG